MKKTAINNQKDYSFYVVNQISSKICDGYEYKEDAQDRRKEIVCDQKELAEFLKVYSKRYLKSIGLEPDHNENWQSIEYFLDTFDLKQIHS